VCRLVLTRSFSKGAAAVHSDGYVFIRPMQRPLHSLNNNDTSNLRVGFLMSSSYASVYGEGALCVGSGKEGRCFSEIDWTNYGRTLVQTVS
jgi:hypothetical protein